LSANVTNIALLSQLMVRNKRILPVPFQLLVYIWCNYLCFHNSQRVRPTIHDVITSKIKAYTGEASKSNIEKIARKTSDVLHSHGPVTLYQLSKQKTKNGALEVATQLVSSPISPAMAPTGDAQRSASQLLGSIFECLVDILGTQLSLSFIAL
jgi:hypothetical protein